jgi:predicted metal-binding membrane protein
MDSALELVLRRDRFVVVAALAAITAIAWIYLLQLSAPMSPPAASNAMPGMDMAQMGAALAPATRLPLLREFLLTFVMWAAMMVGMMTPSAAPMVLLYARVGRHAAKEGKPFAASGWFASGYFLSWTCFALVAALVQEALQHAALITPMMASANWLVSGAVLIAAGLYQWTPLKDACLKQCQSPLGFIQRQGGFRSNALGAQRLGLIHGAYCIGCCWALMALLFVGGVMNLLWVAGIAILVLVEKITPAGRLLSRIAGAALVIAGAVMVYGDLFLR